MRYREIICETVGHKPTRQELSQAIQALAGAWIQAGKAPSTYEINNGLCEEFAGTIVHQFVGHNESEDFMDIDAGNLSVDGDYGEWDADLLKRHWPASVPPHGLTWDEVNSLGIPCHSWIILDGRHYDAECPEGVDNLFDLPLIRRGMEQLARQKPVTEAFDKVPVTWTKQTPRDWRAKTKIGKVNFEIVFYKTTNPEADEWSLFFFEDGGDTLNTGRSRSTAPMVFGWVLSTIEEFLLGIEPDYVCFTGSKQEGKGPLYYRMMLSLMPRLNGLGYRADTRTDDQEFTIRRGVL